jgi:hypothetical protein
MRRNTSFALGYLLVSAGERVAVAVNGYFEIPGGLLGLIVRGADQIPSRHVSFERHCDTLVAPYMPALVEKRRELLTWDAYGQVRHENWSRELGQFMDEILLPRLGRDRPFAQRSLPYLAHRLDDRIAAAQKQSARA